MGALAVDISRGGTSAGSAQAINGAVNSAVSAAGTTLATATDLTATVNVVTTVAASSGVQLPSMMIGDQCEVYNGTTTTLKVYPDQSANAINQVAAGGAISLGQYQGATFRKVTATQIWANLSA